MQINNIRTWCWLITLASWFVAKCLMRRQTIAWFIGCLHKIRIDQNQLWRCLTETIHTPHAFCSTQHYKIDELQLNILERCTFSMFAPTMAINQLYCQWMPETWNMFNWSSQHRSNGINNNNNNNHNYSNKIKFNEYSIFNIQFNY